MRRVSKRGGLLCVDIVKTMHCQARGCLVGVYVLVCLRARMGCEGQWRGKTRLRSRSYDKIGALVAPTVGGVGSG